MIKKIFKLRNKLLRMKTFHIGTHKVNFWNMFKMPEKIELPSESTIIVNGKKFVLTDRLHLIVLHPSGRIEHCKPKGKLLLLPEFWILVLIVLGIVNILNILMSVLFPL